MLAFIYSFADLHGIYVAWLFITLTKVKVQIHNVWDIAFHHEGPTFTNAYCQATTNLIDQDRVGPRPKRSVLSECFVYFNELFL